jgi:hypothetical protein
VHELSDQANTKVLDVVAADGKQSQQNAGERWIMNLAESCIRKLVSQANTAQLVSKSATGYLMGTDGGVAASALSRVIGGMPKFVEALFANAVGAKEPKVTATAKRQRQIGKKALPALPNEDALTE